MIYGGFIMLLVVIPPSSLLGRLCFVFCGGAMFFTGLFLVWHYRRAAQGEASASPQAAKVAA